MSNTPQTKEELLAELEILQHRVRELNRDMATIKKAQEANIVSRDTLQNLIQQLPIGIQIFDTTGTCLDVNQAHLTIFGVEQPEQLIGSYNLFTDPMAKQTGTAPAGHKALTGQTVYLPEIHFDFKQADPQFSQTSGYKIISVTFFPIHNAKNEIVQIVAFNEDITERKQAQKSLQESEERYRTLVEQLPAITYIVEFSKEGNKTIYISPQVETILGFSQTEWLANRELWIKQLHPDDKGRVLAAVKQSNAAGTALNLEYRTLAKDNRVVWFRNQQTTLTQDEQGGLQYVHGIMFDITEHKQLEERLIQAQKMEAVGQMAGGIAHNFNNVLTALMGHTELALTQVSPNSPAHKDLKGVSKSAQRAAKLIQQLLAFTRDQSSNPQTINLNDLLHNMAGIIHQLINKTVTLTLNPAPNLGYIRADSGQIEQVLVNLVINAQDAMLHNGELTIETANITLNQTLPTKQVDILPGEYVVLSVKDTGTGMTEEVQAHIFEPFYSTKEVGKGTGLGLASCFGIVRQHNGYILVNSEPNKGATFKIYLPRIYPDALASAPALKTPSAKTLPQGNETILIVEDALMVREMAVRVLRQQGYNVLAATNGNEALQQIDEHPGLALHLLITDIVMPQMSGDVLAKTLLKTYPNLKVILMSGYSDRAIARRGVLDTQVDTLSKPFTPDALIKKVRSVLDDEKA